MCEDMCIGIQCRRAFMRPETKLLYKSEQKSSAQKTKQFWKAFYWFSCIPTAKARHAPFDMLHRTLVCSHLSLPLNIIAINIYCIIANEIKYEQLEIVIRFIYSNFTTNKL